MRGLTRRTVLRGALHGGAVSVALPLLNGFLNENGTALADGKPLPIRFGTWYWGLGTTHSIFAPAQTGRGYELTQELAPLAGVREHINVLTNFRAFRDASPQIDHFTGWVVARSGIAPAERRGGAPETLDVTTAARIGRTTRFKMLTASASANPRETFSYENPDTPNTAETSPLGLYTRIFGPDFQDPNAPTFTPSPKVMVRKSALSGIMGDIKELNQTVGAEDKAKLDQYFTRIRQIEQQFDQQLTKPDPIAACILPKGPTEDIKAGTEVDLVGARHKAMVDLMVLAAACDQTRVFNIFYGGQDTTKLGYEKPHHTCTHEEPVDGKLGYQVNHSMFTRRAMESWAYYVEAFSKFKEGDGSLLDNCLIVAHTEHGEARFHTLDKMAMFSAGRAGGKVKTGLHVDGGDTSVARLGYTAMRVMGVDMAAWGTNSNNTSKELGEILA